MKRIALLLPEQFFAGGVAGTLDVLNTVNMLAKRGGGSALFEWQLLSEDGAPVRSASGLLLPADGGFDAAQGADAIMVPGIVYGDVDAFERRLATESQLVGRLRDWHATGHVVAGNCTSVALLAESGILDGREATISWWLSGWFRQRYPAVALQTHAVLVDSGTVLCSGATTSYLNLALRLVERFAGPDLALACARLMLVDTHRASQAPYTTLQQYAGHNDPLVTRCQAWLQDHLAQPFRLEALAAAVGASERTLMRRFRRALGDTPLHYLQQMRLFTARQLLESSALGLEQIVEKVGYTDVSTFRRLFKRELQCSPGEYRRRFAAA